jgi:coatomer subunit beta
MASFLENAYSLVHQDNAADILSTNDLRNQLEKGTDESKLETMRRILTQMLNGDPMPNLLMPVIRFVMRRHCHIPQMLATVLTKVAASKSKALKKLLYFYYEICPSKRAQGRGIPDFA